MPPVAEPRPKDRQQVRKPVALTPAVHDEIKAYSERTRRKLREEVILAVEHYLALTPYHNRLSDVAYALGTTVPELLRRVVKQALPALEKEAAG